jgi:hypothetical protein
MKLIPATELADFVYCSKAWELKYFRSAVSSDEAQRSRSKACLACRTGSAARTKRQSDGHLPEFRKSAVIPGSETRWAAFIALMLAVLLFFFVWMGWAR